MITKKMSLTMPLCLLFAFLINNVFSTDCGGIYTKTECNAVSQCDWSNPAINCTAFDGNNTCNLCECKSTVPLDIIFVIDSSDSIGPTNFELQKSWLKYIFNNQISSNSRIAFIIFATHVNGITNPSDSPLAFWHSSATEDNRTAITPELINFVDNIRYIGGARSTQPAIGLALDWFQQYRIQGRKQVLILITNGEPNKPDFFPSVCIHPIFGVYLFIIQKTYILREFG